MNIIRISKLIFLLVIPLLLFSSCGKKPRHLDPPVDRTDPAYPRSYPAPLPPDTKPD